MTHTSSDTQVQKVTRMHLLASIAMHLLPLLSPGAQSWKSVVEGAGHGMKCTGANQVFHLSGKDLEQCSAACKGNTACKYFAMNPNDAGGIPQP